MSKSSQNKLILRKEREAGMVPVVAPMLPALFVAQHHRHELRRIITESVQRQTLLFCRWFLPLPERQCGQDLEGSDERDAEASSQGAYGNSGSERDPPKQIASSCATEWVFCTERLRHVKQIKQVLRKAHEIFLFQNCIPGTSLLRASP